MSHSSSRRTFFTEAFPSVRAPPSTCRYPYSVLVSMVTGYTPRNRPPVACSSSSSGRVDGRQGDGQERGCPLFKDEPTGHLDRSLTGAATDPEAFTNPTTAPIIEPPRASLAATKPLEQMTPREVMRLLPTEDQEHVMRVARQGRLFGVVSAAAAGTWVYRALRRRGSPLPVAGGALIGIVLGYPLGITLTMAFHGRFLRRISRDLMETQRRARERVARNGPPSSEYYSTFPTGEPESERQGRPPWEYTTELLGDTRAEAAAAGSQKQPPHAGSPATGAKGSRVDGTGKGDEILRV